MQVIADHARTTAFLIADGVTPSNEWRGYVLRRIMRRAMRHGRLLGLAEPFLWRTVEWVAELMRDAYPELATEHGRIEAAVRDEEERFAEALDTGMQLIEEYDEARRRRAARGVTSPPVLDGSFLFKLYDTHGFPRDLAEEIFRDKGWQVTDETNAAYEAEMQTQRERARAGATFGAGDATAEATAIYQRLGAELPAIEFVGYDTLTAPARILAIVDPAEGGARRVREAGEGAEVEMILDRTPAYAESGGQVGDTGTLAGRAGRGRILDTYYRGPKLIVHRVRVIHGGFHENEDVAVSIETPRRQGLRQHHTATHLLHAALRKVLGTHVTQAGSLVAPDHLRFDFAHVGQVKDRELGQVEELVNEQVQANTPVTRLELDLDEALRMGALALFGEKYGDRVRVIKIGDFSTELCGGTHLDQTGEIGLLKVQLEGAVAAGVRRIEAVAGTATLEAKLARSRAAELVAAARQINGVAVIAARVDGLDAEGLRAVADTLRDRLSSGVVCVGGVTDGKVSLIAAVTKDLTQRFQAGRIIQAVAQESGRA